MWHWSLELWLLKIQLNITGVNNILKYIQINNLLYNFTKVLFFHNFNFNVNCNHNIKLSLITSTWLHLISSKILIILHHSYSCYVNTLYNLFAHSSCTFLRILLFITSTVYCLAHFILLHVFFMFLFLFFKCCTYFFHTYIYVYFLVFVLHIIALSMEQTWLTFHCWLYSV